MSANIDTCSADGPPSLALAFDVLSSGASMSYLPTQHTSRQLATSRERRVGRGK